MSYQHQKMIKIPQDIVPELERSLFSSLFKRLYSKIPAEIVDNIKKVMRHAFRHKEPEYFFEQTSSSGTTPDHVLKYYTSADYIYIVVIY